jgi:hypothetical protein
MVMLSRLFIALIAVFLGVVTHTHAIPSKPVPNIPADICVSLVNFDINPGLHINPPIPGLVTGCYCLNGPNVNIISGFSLFYPPRCVQLISLLVTSQFSSIRIPLLRLRRR